MLCSEWQAGGPQEHLQEFSSAAFLAPGARLPAKLAAGSPVHATLLPR
jgi:hypothetical protein